MRERFLKRLWLSKTGQYIDSFRKWKTIPLQKDNALLKLGAAFERKLNKLIHNGLKSSFDPLKDINFEAL